MNHPERVIVRWKDYQDLLTLAQCGINDGAGTDEELENIEARVERDNPEFKAYAKGLRAQAHAELMAHQRKMHEDKIWARKNSGKEMYLMLEGGWSRIRVKICGWKSGGVHITTAGTMEHIAQVTEEEARRLPVGSSISVSNFRFVHIPNPCRREELVPLDSQFGPPRKQVVGVYEPGSGLDRKGGSLDRS